MTSTSASAFISQPATLLFAHGARDPLWARPFEAIAAHMRVEEPERLVRLAFLEFMSPDLGGAVDELVALGARHISLVPVFLGAGGHVRRDLPRLIDEAVARHPGIAVTVTPAIGESAPVVCAIAHAAAKMVLETEQARAKALAVAPSSP